MIPDVQIPVCPYGIRAHLFHAIRTSSDQNGFAVKGAGELTVEKGKYKNGNMDILRRIMLCLLYLTPDEWESQNSTGMMLLNLKA